MQLFISPLLIRQLLQNSWSLAHWNVLSQYQIKSEYPISKGYDQPLSFYDFCKFKFGNKGSIEWFTTTLLSKFSSNVNNRNQIRCIKVKKFLSIS